MKCARCGCGLIQQRAWAKASSNERAAWLAAGKNVLQGRGWCRKCYLRAWRRAKRLHVTLDAL